MTQLVFSPALDRPDLLAAPVAELLGTWPHAGEVQVAEIDPGHADTAAMTEAYGLPLTDSANCVVVSGRRAGEERLAACLVRADTRADVNNLVKRTLDVRKASFHPMERAVEETGMEYGGITPLGLPEGWRLLVDERVLGIARAIVGSGVRRSKLFLPGARLADLPGAEVVPGLAHPS
ncbi:YbaK/EbsC family protein [Nocardioides donggukensis]|nr:YbaK/EbsC family protein [Nocardioides donggukensis]